MGDVNAFIFDLNGTMVDDMEYHGKAWFDILTNDLQASLTFEEVRREMYGKNEEVLVRIFGEGRFTPEKMKSISLEKERRYQEAFKPHLQLISGLADFLEKASSKNIAMAIGSAAIPFNIDFVLDNLNIGRYFSAIVSADDVNRSKPDPETFTKACMLLGAEPSRCVVFEDAPKGVESAWRAGMKCVALTTTHQQHEFSEYPNIIAFIKDYNDPFLAELL